MASNLPLHKTVHWREIRDILEAICRHEKIKFSAYDTQHIRCYRTVGLEMQGKFVCYNTKGGKSCWVENNVYDVFEARHPGSSYKEKFLGDYMILAYNVSFNYWLYGFMKVGLKKSLTRKESHFVFEVMYCLYGKYNVFGTIENGSVIKTEYGRDCDFCFRNSTAHYFDSIGTRLKAYGATNYYAEKYLHISHNQGNIEGGSRVRIYKKKH